MMQKIESNSANKRYRSIKYRSLSSNIRPNKIIMESRNDSVLKFSKKDIRLYMNNNQSVFNSEKQFSVSLSIKKQQNPYTMLAKRNSVDTKLLMSNSTLNNP